MPVVKQPAPDHEVNSGGTYQLSSVLYKDTMIRVHNEGCGGWGEFCTGSGDKTIFQLVAGGVLGSAQVYDDSNFVYDGGTLKNLLEIWGTVDVVVTTSGNVDWTLDGDPVAGFFQVLDYTLNERHVLEGTLDGGAGRLEFVNHAVSNLAGVGATVSVWTI